jgi:DNA invertase Pin-like site-specific DNA recombinase
MISLVVANCDPRVSRRQLSRSLANFDKLIESFDGHGVSFVSVTRQFNTLDSF